MDNISKMKSLVNDRMGYYFNKYKSLFIFLLFFPHVYHSWIPFDFIYIINYYLEKLRIYTFFILVILFIIKKKKPSKLLLLLIIGDIWILFTTILNNYENMYNAQLYICSSISIAMIIELFISNINEMISGLLFAFELQLYPNLITVILYRNVSFLDSINGYHFNNFLLGTRNDLILYLFPAFFLCIVSLLINKRKIRTISLLAIIITTIFLCKSVTTLLAFIFFILVFTYYFIRKNRIKSVYRIACLPIIVLLVIVLPYLIIGYNPVVDFFMNNIYYRHSFISRTAIWVDSLRYIANSPMTGYGFLNSSLHMVDDVGRIYDNAHCEMIQRILNYGVIGLLMFMIFNLVLLKKINNLKDSIYKTIFVSFMCAIYLTFVSQNYHRFFEFYIIMFFAYNFNNIERKEE